MSLPTFATLDSIYAHTSGAGNTGYWTVITNKRVYAATLAAASANSIQFVQAEQVKRVYLSTKCAAAGAIEISRVSTSQIATANPTKDVLARVDVEPVTTSGMPQQNYAIEY